MFGLRLAARRSSRSLRGFSVDAPTSGTAGGLPVNVYNPNGAKRVIVTKPLPGTRWLEILIASGLRVEVCALDGPEDTILTVDKIAALIGSKCDGAYLRIILTRDHGVNA
jgi:hypothetical protein